MTKCIYCLYDELVSARTTAQVLEERELSNVAIATQLKVLCDALEADLVASLRVLPVDDLETTYELLVERYDDSARVELEDLMAAPASTRH